jgi:trimeric autotransporter adhesin
MRKLILGSLCFIISSWLSASILIADGGTRNQPLSLEGHLRPDGTLNVGSGFAGTFDPTGYVMTTGLNGEPHFAKDPGLEQENQVGLLAGPDDNWTKRFGPPGPDGYVNAIAVKGSDIYVGGSFKMAGEVVANNVARWDGTKWNALNTGVDGTVRVIFIDGNDIYVGGNFTNAGTLVANCIARWDGQKWNSCGGGTNGEVRAIVKTTIPLIDGNLLPTLYIAGYFTKAGGATVNYVAAYDILTRSWTDLQGGATGVVLALAMVGPTLYAGGIFPHIGNVAASNISKYEGGEWKEIKNGPNGTVYSMVTLGLDVYVAGSFDKVGNGAGSAYFTKLSGGSFGNIGIIDGPVYNLSTDGFYVYLAGSFTFAGVKKCNNVARYSAGFDPFGLGVNGKAWAILPDPNATDIVYAGGDFTTSDSSNVPYFARWNKTSFNRLGDSPAARVTAVFADTLQLPVIKNFAQIAFVGGDFKSVGDVGVGNLALWSPIGWTASVVPPAPGPNGPIYAFARKGKTLYGGGTFNHLGLNIAFNIAKLDGITWNAVGAGVGALEPTAQVRAIAFIGNDMYVAGSFLHAGGVSGSGVVLANNIARWSEDDTLWHALGSGVDGTVNAMAVVGSDLYVGGAFTHAGGTAANYIAKWNGTSWQTMGTGANDVVYAMTSSGSDLFVGGQFTAIGGSSGFHIARYDGSKWNALSFGVDNKVLAMAAEKKNLYVAGEFRFADPSGVYYVAKWNGTTWSPFGSGLNARSLAITALNGVVTVGGEFTQAGGRPALYLAQFYDGATTSVTEHTGVPSSFGLSQNYPNPFNPTTNFEFRTANVGLVTLKIHDVLGREVATLVNEVRPAGLYTIRWDASAFPSGVYFCKLQAGDSFDSKKVVLLK